MSTPSLLNIPYRLKAGTLYSQLPETGAGDFTVSRTTTPTAGQSTRINSLGNIELVADNVPRLDYPLGGAVNGCPALLVEPAATNLVLQSQAFDVTWSPLINGTGVNPAITTNAVISPDGTQNAERIVFNRGAGNTTLDQSTLQQNITIPTTGAYILSVYAKASTAGDVGKQIFIRIGGAGTLTPITLTANWVRYSRAETSVASGSQAVQIGNRGTFTADNSVSVDLWGAQAEGGAIPTSYIPTTTAAVTRSADVVNKASVSSLIGQAEGTIYAEVVLSNNSSGSIFLLDNGSTSTFLNIVRNTAQNIQVTLRNSGGTIATIITSSALANGVHKIALSYTNGAYSLYINGSPAGTSTNSTDYPASLTRASISTSDYGAPYFPRNDRVRAVALYPNRLPNTAAPGVLSLATLTTP